MTSASTQPEPSRNHAHAAHGDELLAELRKGWAPLPTATLLSMAMAGLRVRLVRSIVTVLSIVLAIAFLTYTGLSSYQGQNLVRSMHQYESAPPAQGDALTQAIGNMSIPGQIVQIPLGQKIQLARDWGFADVSKIEDELAGLTGSIQSAKYDLEQARATLAKTEADAKASGAEPVQNNSGQGKTGLDKDSSKAAAPSESKVSKSDLNLKRAAVADAETKVADLTSLQHRVTQKLLLGQWVDAKGIPADPKLAEQLDAELQDRQKKLVEQGRDFNRLSDVELLQFDQLRETLPSVHPDDTKILDQALEAERLKRKGRELGRLLRQAGVNPDRSAGASVMDAWLIIMAMMTCAVGIANAMLMSVTERFREIGTMKCLGAQDNLVVKLFLLESGFLGAIGAVFGVILGLVVSVVAAAISFGGFWREGFAGPLQLLIVLSASMLCGIILSVVGAVYPAYSASRMRPVDALRVDE